MAIVRKPSPAPSDEPGLGSDEYMGPLKKVDEVKFDELTPERPPLAETTAAPPPPPPKPAPAAAPPAPPPPAAKAVPTAARIVGRLTVFADLGLSHEIADDPDARRFFEYMRLFAPEQVPGGLYGLPYERARQVLQAGRWGKHFTVELDRLIADGLPGSRVLVASRFYGMRPVYKAFATAFNSDKALRQAIFEDVQLFAKLQRASNRFPPFAYRTATVIPDPVLAARF